jgi:hypothetical protein
VKLGIHPGEHAFTVSTEDGKELTWKVRIENGSTNEHTFELTKIQTAPTATAVPTATAAPTGTGLPTEAPMTRPVPTSVKVMLGVTGAFAVGAGVMMGLASVAKTNYDEVNGTGASDVEGKRNNVVLMNGIADGLLGGTVLAAGTTLVLYLVRPSVKARPRRPASSSPPLRRPPRAAWWPAVASRRSSSVAFAASEGGLDLEPGTVVANRYRISRAIGRGGMGEVFAAENIRTGRPVAVKLLRADSKSKASAVERFRREARAAGSINSDHVTQVLDVEDDAEHGIVIVFELLEGESLIDRLKRTGPIPFDELHPIIEEVWVGLSDAHKVGIIHRDLKPSNVFLERRPDGHVRVKILDFGISKLPKEMGGETLTEMGQSLGTFSFMPPEQIGRAKTVDHRADIYATTTMIYQSLTGQLPYIARNILVMVEMKSKTERARGAAKARTSISMRGLAQIAQREVDLLERVELHERALVARAVALGRGGDERLVGRAAFFIWCRMPVSVATMYFFPGRFDGVLEQRGGRADEVRERSTGSSHSGWAMNFASGCAPSGPRSSSR